MTQIALPKKTPVKAAIAGWTGTMLEYYDFAVYGTSAALVLNVLFFSPELPQGVSVLLAMVTFAVGYFVRPLGSLILGPMGDRFGRKFVMLVTLFGIGGCTFLVGCLPTYSQVGALAPILLILLRVIQGLCLSGEQPSSITMSLEHAPESRRGFLTSFTTLGASSGTLLTLLVFIPISAMPSEQLLTWGWRLPFWFSAVVVVVAYFIRRHLSEPPAFIETQSVKVNIAPLHQAVRYHWRAIVRIVFCALVAGVSYMMQTYSVAFGTTGYKLDKPSFLLMQAVASIVALAITPLSGFLVDKLGRRTMFLAGAIGAGVTMAPYLWSVTTGNWALMYPLAIINYSLFYSMVNAAWPSFFAEMFPSRVRVSGLAIGTQIGFALSGALGPVLSTALAGPDLRGWVGPSVVALGFMLCAVISALTAKETRKYTLKEVDELQQTEREKDAVTAATAIPTRAAAGLATD
ncbi:MFS transporter [Leifsonia shinshuensis]|uniref:MHS family MFS transporter n=1 Tax=Leifsonia shinshuensis TaxID=150026 RepID=A0A7G6YE30_9MICO|nr:MFS transporter [Leifsonia shinshuensis]QNE36745.1 MHS family MFS transporter [Leifsonia shinshuensis]